MNANGPLEFTLKQILSVIKPSREDWEIRVQIIEDLRTVVESVVSLRGATVEPFGSFVSNLFSRWGDLDISVELPNGSYILYPGRKQKQNLLRDLLKALRRKAGWRKVRIIANARVPILKSETTYLNISCDISLNNLIGQMKSKFLFWISEIDERFRDMVLLVKEWAKAHDINDPRSGTLNSYSYTLLVIFHFQTCVPAILPPLKEIYPGNMVDGLTGVRADAERLMTETCAANLERFRSDRSRRLNQSSLSELFISFLGKFSNIDSMALELGICPYTGQWEHIDSNMRWLPRTYTLFIEDPFEQPQNAARAITNRELPRISEIFRATHSKLVVPIHNQNSLVTSLVKPEIAQLIARTPQNPTGFPGTYPRTRPQVHTHRASQRPPQVQHGVQVHAHRASQPPPQVQHWVQNARPEGPSNTFVPQRPVQAIQSRSQQVWKPRSD